MTPGFDPNALSQRIAEGKVILPVTSDIERFRPNAVGNAALLSLLTIVSGWLAGERRQLADSLRFAIAWLEDAEARNEKYGEAPWSNQAERKRALALARWLNNGSAERRLWHAAAQTAAKAVVTGKVSQAEFAEYYLADSLLDFLLSGKRLEGVALAARVDEIPQAKWPIEACFALECCEVTGSAFPADWQGFLQARLKRWLDEGEFIRAACWMKYFVGQGGLDAEAVLLRAYDFMPGLTPPAIAKTETGSK